MDSIRLLAIQNKLHPALANPLDRYIIVSVEEQKLYLCSDGTITEVFDCSTSRFGAGNRENSLRTPLGLHRVCERYGDGAPPGRVFRDRLDAGENWDHGRNGDNLILSRILRLEGLEPGINRGPGIDSYERYIYIHGTGREDLVGTPLSHGCVVMRNLDVIRLFDLAPAGTLVLIDPAPLRVLGRPCRNIHFTGIFGSGMSALAQYLRFQGLAVSGSDRFHRSEDTAGIRRSLEALGCAIAPQDGSGVAGETDAVCISTAIEESNPDIRAARDRGIPIVHRSDLLAAVIETKRTIAVAGTSGKSTVTAMIFEFLDRCGKSPSLLSGACLRRLEREGMVGNAWSGGSDLLVVEADESDGTLVKYRPEAAVILNVSKDHKDVEELTKLFATLAGRSSWTAVNADDPRLSEIPGQARFGGSGSSTWRHGGARLDPRSVSLEKDGFSFRLSLPGKHNLENLAAALCVCEHFGCLPSQLAEAVPGYEGVARRFVITATRRGVVVVDDFAHNPAKIAAAVEAAHGLAGRVIALYQPHGFGPTRFLKDEYISTFRTVFRPGDSLRLLPIYYAGGTARKDISSADIIEGLGPVLFSARAVADRGELLQALRTEARPGDCVLLMGARDPSLPSLARDIIARFGGAEKND